jgi:hypothetical protein
VNRKQLQIKGQLIAGALLTDTANVIRELDRAGGIPQGVSFDGDAGAVIAAAKQIPRDVIGDEASLMLMDAVEAARIKGKRYDALADKGSPLEVAGLIADLKCHADDVAAAAVIAEKGDAAYKLHALQAVYATQIDTASTDARTVDAAGWITDDPPLHDPVIPLLFDHHALFELVGPSKVRKSFVLMQIALGLATGRGGFGFDGAVPFRVLLADMELTAADMHRRLHRMARAMCVTAADIEDRLGVLNLAGVDNPMKAIEKATAGRNVDILLADPLYSLGEGGENIEDLRPVLKWLRKLATRLSAVGYVHHDGKGFAGERSTRDRGSGSGITGRAVDARITLTPSAADPDNTIVMGFMCRSYQTPQPSVWTFDRSLFVPSDLPATTETFAGSKARSGVRKLSTYEAGALTILRERGPLSPAVFKQVIRESLGASKNDADVLTASLVGAGTAARWRSGGFHPSYMIGLPTQQPASPASQEAGREAQ